MMTIREKKGEGKKRVLLTWAWHPKPLPMAVPNSFLLAAAQMGQDVVVAHPKGYELDPELVETARTFAKLEGGSVNLSNDVYEAFDGVEVVYAKSWGSSRFYGAPEQDIAERAPYRKDWIVDEAKMARTRAGIFMHCLPAHRGEEVTDEVIDGPQSVVFDEAENRLHAQKGILVWCLNMGRP